MNAVRQTIKQGVKIRYIHGGARKTAYYDVNTRIFVAMRGRKVLAVINNVNRRYVMNKYRGR